MTQQIDLDDDSEKLYQQTIISSSSSPFGISSNNKKDINTLNKNVTSSILLLTLEKNNYSQKKSYKSKDAENLSTTNETTNSSSSTQTTILPKLQLSNNSTMKDISENLNVSDLLISNYKSAHDFKTPRSPKLINKQFSSSSTSRSYSLQQHWLQDPNDTTNGKILSSPSSSTILNDRKYSRLCDTTESFHNTTITTTPAASSRYSDREGKSSLSRKLSEDSSDDKIQEGLCGLRNIGNTCFMNSVIQCLSHTRELTKFLKCRNGTKTSKDQQILYEFSKLIREMWSSNVRSVTPLDLKSAFSSKHRMYSGYNQQDAQEFLRFFLDSLHCALNTGVKGEYIKIDDNLNDNKKADLNWESYSKVENSVIKDLFVGQLKSTLKCTTCGNTSVTFDPFWDLSVPLPTSSRCKLDACLDFFIREEILDADEMPTCSKCQTRRKCTKSLTIQRFPKYLVIHLKRFSETRWSKLSNIVEFPTGEKELNMTGYASNPNCSALYTLYAISNHMGSTAGGHYVALCKHPTTKKWHEFNDNAVSNELSETALVSSSAYLLFYERA